MSSNTQAQGRTLFTERGFTFTPRTGVTGWGPAVGDDATRSLYRWEAALQEQLKVGNVIYDAAAKQAAMDRTVPAPAPAPAPAPSPSPSPSPAPSPSPSPSPAPAPSGP